MPEVGRWRDHGNNDTAVKQLRGKGDPPASHRIPGASPSRGAGLILPCGEASWSQLVSGTRRGRAASPQLPRTGHMEATVSLSSGVKVSCGFPHRPTTESSDVPGPLQSWIRPRPDAARPPSTRDALDTHPAALRNP
eukprot:364479-Chlamydomonas_euryale.AAC.2